MKKISAKEFNDILKMSDDELLVELTPQHTPMPLKKVWYVDNGKSVGVISPRRFSIECESNIPGIPATVATVQYGPHAAFIVRAVNCYQELLEALKSYHSECLSCEKSRFPCPYNQAIAKAEGK